MHCAHSLYLILATVLFSPLGQLRSSLSSKILTIKSMVSLHHGRLKFSSPPTRRLTFHIAPCVVGLAKPSQRQGQQQHQSQHGCLRTCRICCAPSTTAQPDPHLQDMVALLHTLICVLYSWLLAIARDSAPPETPPRPPSSFSAPHRMRSWS